MPQQSKAQAPAVERVVLLTAQPCRYDARVMRTASLLAQSGRAVTVVCARHGALPDRETIEGAGYVRVPLDRFSEGGGWAALALGLGRAARAIGLAVVGEVIEKYFEPDILSANAMAEIDRMAPDLVHVFGLSALAAGVRGAAAHGAFLIYDSPELERHRAARYFAPIRLKRARLEGALIRRADAVVTVSDACADDMARHFAIAKPSVMMNAPLAGGHGDHGDHGDATIREVLGLSSDTVLAVYAGTIGPGRGLETIVRALALAPDIHLAMFGPRRGGTEADMRRLADRLAVADRIHYPEAVAHGRVVDFIASADFGLIMFDGDILSYRYSMPNKLFQYAFAGLPVVTRDLPDIARFVRRWKCGVVLDDAGPGSLAEAMKAVANDPPQAALNWAERCAAIRAAYGGEEQRRALESLYQRVQAN